MAEGGELADEVARVAIVEVGVEVDVPGVGVGEEVPHADEDRALDGDECLLLSLSSREGAVALPRAGVGLRGRGRNLAQDAFEALAQGCRPPPIDAAAS